MSEKDKEIDVIHISKSKLLIFLTFLSVLIVIGISAILFLLITDKRSKSNDYYGFYQNQIHPLDVYDSTGEFNLEKTKEARIKQQAGGFYDKNGKYYPPVDNSSKKKNNQSQGVRYSNNQYYTTTQYQYPNQQNQQYNQQQYNQMQYNQQYNYGNSYKNY